MRDLIEYEKFFKTPASLAGAVVEAAAETASR